MAPSSRWKLRARARRAKSRRRAELGLGARGLELGPPPPTPPTIGQWIDRVVAIAQLADDGAYRLELEALARERPGTSALELGALVSLTGRIAGDLAAAWAGDGEAYERLRARPAAPPVVGVGPAALARPLHELLVSTIVHARCIASPAQRHAILRARAEHTAAEREAYRRLITDGAVVVRQLIAALTLNSDGTAERLKDVRRVLTREDGIEARRRKVLAAVRALPDIELAIGLLLDADRAFHAVDEAVLRAELGRDYGRLGDYAIAAGLSLVARAFGDHVKPGDGADLARARERIAQCYRAAE